MLSHHHAWLLAEDFPGQDPRLTKELNLSNSPLIVDNPGFVKLAFLPNLVSLVLNKCEVRSMEILCDLCHLQFLGLGGNKIRVLPCENRIKMLSRLVAFDLSDNKISSHDEFLKLAILPELRALKIYGNPLIDNKHGNLKDSLPRVEDWGNDSWAWEDGGVVEKPGNENSQLNSPRSIEKSGAQEDPIQKAEEFASPETAGLSTPSSPSSPYPPAVDRLSGLEALLAELEVDWETEDLEGHFKSIDSDLLRAPPEPATESFGEEISRSDLDKKAEKLDFEIDRTKKSLAKNEEISSNTLLSLRRARGSYLEFLNNLKEDLRQGRRLRRLAGLLIEKEKWLDSEGKRNDQFERDSEIKLLEMELVARHPSGSLAELHKYTEICNRFSAKFETHTRFVSELKERLSRLITKLKSINLVVARKQLLNAQPVEYPPSLEEYLSSFKKIHSASPTIQVLIDRLRDQHMLIIKIASAHDHQTVVSELLKDRELLINQFLEISSQISGPFKSARSIPVQPVVSDLVPIQPPPTPPVPQVHLRAQAPPTPLVPQFHLRAFPSRPSTPPVRPPPILSLSTPGRPIRQFVNSPARNMEISREPTPKQQTVKRPSLEEPMFDDFFGKFLVPSPKSVLRGISPNRRGLSGLIGPGGYGVKDSLSSTSSRPLSATRQTPVRGPSPNKNIFRYPRMPSPAARSPRKQKN